MTQKNEWGSTEAQRRLDRRLVQLDRRFRVVRVSVDGMEERYQQLRDADDEDGLRALAEAGERAVALFEAASRPGGGGLVPHPAF